MMRNNKKFAKILGLWCIIWGCVFVSGMASGFITKYLVTNKFYSKYYEIMISNTIFYIGSSICLVGLFIQISVFFIKSKKVLSSIITLSICTALICINYLSLNNGYMYMNVTSYIEDYKYIENNSYCENNEIFKNIYMDESYGGRGSHTCFYLETESNKYVLDDNIINKDTFNEFKKKFKSKEEIKIKYLPNSQMILEVEPMK